MPHRVTRRVSITWALAAAALIVYSCTDGGVAPTVNVAQSFSLQTSPGVIVNSQQMDAQLTRLTRSVARALGRSAALRERVRGATANSPFPEGKLEFKAIMDDDAFGLRSAMAQADGRRPGDVSRALDSIVGLELYLPVSEHRASWAGEDDLIVASLFSDDPGHAISAFDLSGRRVALDLYEKPDRPVLSLVPAETDFSRLAPSQTQSVGSVAQYEGATAGFSTASYTGGSGLYMTYSYLPDLHEPWLLGDPEIAVHIGVVIDDNLEWRDCAGDAFLSGTPQHFDQNSHSWNGPAARITEAGMILNQDTRVYVWEDDWGRCNGYLNLEPSTDDGTMLVVGAFVATLSIVLTIQTPLTLAQTAYGVAYGTFSFFESIFSDDFVGSVEVNGAGCYEEGLGSIQYDLVGLNGYNTGGKINLDNSADIDRILCPTLPLTGSISGPSLVRPSDACLWQAFPTGGVPPYTYNWYGVLSGTGPSVWGFVSSSGWLKVDIASSDSQQKTVMKFVSVDSGAPECMN